MQLWRYVLAGSVCASLAFVPQKMATEMAAMPVLNNSPELAKLTIQKATPSHSLPARSPISAFSTSNKPLSGITICVDPGHGGQALTKTHYTGGTVGVATGQTESDVNLRVSLMLRAYLEASGAKVVMTRLADVRCQGDTCKRAELDFRSDIANANNADLFVSVHHNEASGKPNTNYTAVFHPQGVTASIGLAENISNAVSKYLGTNNVGAKIGDYRVLNRVKMPGVIVEASFMSSPSEDSRLAQLSYNKMEAKAIATGILNYIRLSHNRKVDFNGIFAPIDSQAGSAQMMADATFVRRQVVERRSLFGVKYEELTYDANGGVISRREVGNSSLAAKQSSRKSSTVAKAKSAARKVASSTTSKVKSTASKTRVVISKASSSAAKSKPVVSSSKSKSESKSKPVVSSSKPESKSKPVVSSKSSAKKDEIIKAVSTTKSPGKKSTSVAAAKD